MVFHPNQEMKYHSVPEGSPCACFKLLPPKINIVLIFNTIYNKICLFFNFIVTGKQQILNIRLILLAIFSS